MIFGTELAGHKLWMKRDFICGSMCKRIFIKHNFSEISQTIPQIVFFPKLFFTYSSRKWVSCAKKYNRSNSTNSQFKIQNAPICFHWFMYETICSLIKSNCGRVFALGSICNQCELVTLHKSSKSIHRTEIIEHTQRWCLVDIIGTKLSIQIKSMVVQHMRVIIIYETMWHRNSIKKKTYINTQNCPSYETISSWETEKKKQNENAQHFLT